MPHPRAGHVPARQPDRLLGPPVAELDRRRDDRRRRRLGVEPIRIAQVHQVEVRREPVGDRPLQLRRRRHAHRPGQHGGQVIEQGQAHHDPRPARPAAARLLSRPRSRLRLAVDGSDAAGRRPATAPLDATRTPPRPPRLARHAPPPGPRIPSVRSLNHTRRIPVRPATLPQSAPRGSRLSLALLRFSNPPFSTILTFLPLNLGYDGY